MSGGAHRRWVVWALVGLLAVFVAVVLALVYDRDGAQTGLPGDGGVPAEVIERVAPAALHVTGEACERTQNGSGAVVAAELVVTNAHVVAGMDTPSVLTADGSTFDAVVVWFDADADLAVLRAEGLAVTPLRLDVAGPPPGSTGLVLGVAPDASLEPVPYRVVRQVTLRVSDIYGSRPLERPALELEAAIGSGDSGGALVGLDGSLVGLVFAADRGGRPLGYAHPAAEVAAVISSPLDVAVDTGPCLELP